MKKKQRSANFQKRKTDFYGDYGRKQNGEMEQIGTAEKENKFKQTVSRTGEFDADGNCTILPLFMWNFLML